MLQRTIPLLRRGQPNPPRGNRHYKVPFAHRPFQGGQQHFQEMLLRRANDAATLERRPMADAAAAVGGGGGSAGAGGAGGGFSAAARALLPEQNVVLGRGGDATFAVASSAAAERAEDGFTGRRSFNERDFYERVQAEMLRHQQAGRSGADALTAALQSATLSGSAQPGDAQSLSAAEAEALADASGAPRTIVDEADFEAAHGFSMIKAANRAGASGRDKQRQRPEFAVGNQPYGALDLWSEQPVYPPGTYFLYLIARRRNAYAVIFDRDGKRVHPVYTVGNRGLKDSDRGFRVEGSAENAHQVTSMYLSDALPRLRELEAEAGRGAASRGAAGGSVGGGGGAQQQPKIELVVRVLGFYNGRQGAIRAVTDHSDAYVVRHVEDVTPFPLNGPRMPRAKVKSHDMPKG
jgi:hypothetical protein